MRKSILRNTKRNVLDIRQVRIAVCSKLDRMVAVARTFFAWRAAPRVYASAAGRATPPLGVHVLGQLGVRHPGGLPRTS